MRRLTALLTALILASALAMGLTGPSTAEARGHTPPGQHLVPICHVTQSTTNPSVLINVNVHAERAHVHHGDWEPGGPTGTGCEVAE